MTRQPLSPRCALGAVLLALVACGSEQSATQLMVVVTAEPSIADTITHLDVAVCDPGASDPQGRPMCVDYHSFSFGRGGVNVLPLSFGLAKRKEDEVLLMVGGYRDQQPIVEQKVYARFVQGELHRVTMALAERCKDVICSNQTTSLTTCYPEEGSADGEAPCVSVAEAKTQPIDPMGEFEGLGPAVGEDELTWDSSRHR